MLGLTFSLLPPFTYTLCRCSTSAVFGLQVPEACTGVPTEVLHPEASWKDPEAFEAKLKDLGGMFSKVRALMRGRLLIQGMGSFI